MTGLWVLIGIAGVVVILIIIVIIVAVCCFCKKKKSSPVSPSAPQGVQMQPEVAAPVVRQIVTPSVPMGVQIQPQVAVPVAATDPYAQVGKFAKLRDLKELLDGGVLTQEEFDTQKKAILGE